MHKTIQSLQRKNRMFDHYDVKKYKKANLLFDSFIENCAISTPEQKQFGEFKVSTITCVSSIGTKIDIKNFYEAIDENDTDIIYAKYSNNIKGNKPVKNKKKNRKTGSNNQLFSNQTSLGFRCIDATHTHKNPISMKIFRNGRIQVTGCKDINEIKNMYLKLHHKINKLQKNMDLIQDLENFQKQVTHIDDDIINIEMINGTFYINQTLDLSKVLEMFLKKYTHDEVFIIQNKKSPLNFSIKLLGYFDKKKCKDKIPSVFIYNTGAINIIATKKHILYETYQFMKKNLEEMWSEIIEKKIIYNDKYLNEEIPKLSTK